MGSHFVRLGQTDEERHFEDMIECRDRVQGIMKECPTQDQILQIIYLLSLEIEDRGAMLSIISVARTAMSDWMKTIVSAPTPSVSENPEKRLILK